MVELVDTQDLGSCAVRCVSSSLTIGIVSSKALRAVIERVVGFVHHLFDGNRSYGGVTTKG